ncbi:hypothetical protein C6V83_02095 [Gordonia iterans]|uniref:Transposase IS30-like HTH domain-containing protein n=1 Tax=Gordonia iterans TaxID=1004901 RepID=A0A2S0KC65_9ACTN|nr:hypothetical protein C6V83_02095 [Gordonia iterans]
MGRRALTEEDRAEIAVGVKAGWTLTKIADGIGRCKSIVSREVRRNATATGRYRPVHAGRAAAARRSRPQLHAVAADPRVPAQGHRDHQPPALPRGDRPRAQRTPPRVPGLLHAREKFEILLRSHVASTA